MFNLKKRRALFIFMTCVMLIFSMSSCSKIGKADKAEEIVIDESAAQGVAGAEVAFILPSTDESAIGISGWVQKSWAGVKNYCEGNGKTYTWFVPAWDSTQGFSSVIDKAVSGGAKIVVTAGPGSAEAVAEVQGKNPDVKFIAVEADGIQSLIGYNTYAVFHQVNEAGFLAGVAAVKGGFNNIGILIGFDNPQMNSWCYGYIQGINYAAGAGGTTGINVRQQYVNSVTVSPEIQDIAAKWYADGCDLIIPVMEGGNLSLFAAAEKAKKPCFGSDVDQGELSEMVLTGAVRHIDASISEALKSASGGDFPGGTYKWFTVSDNRVGLAEANWRMDQFGYSLSDYKADFEAFKANVDKQRSSLKVESISRKDPGMNAFEALMNDLEKKNIGFNAIK